MSKNKVSINSGYFELDVVAYNRPFHWRAIFDDEAQRWSWKVELGDFTKYGSGDDYSHMLKNAYAAMKMLSEMTSETRMN